MFWELVRILYLFWNINGKNLTNEIVQMIEEHNIGVVILAEAGNLDWQHLLYELERKGLNFTYCNAFNGQESDIMVFHLKQEQIELMKCARHYSVYKVHNKDSVYTMFVVHLLSGCFKNESARITRLTRMSQLFEKIEEEIYEEEEFRSFVIGDFNLQPFSAGIIGSMSFNATFSMYKAKEDGVRIVDHEKRRFYFNPMWRLMGKNEEALGTYYSSSDEGDNSFYWYTWDQVLIRPALIDQFNFDEFSIIDSVGSEHLVTQNQVISRAYSDHLPIKFEIR